MARIPKDERLIYIGTDMFGFFSHGTGHELCPSQYVARQRLCLFATAALTYSGVKPPGGNGQALLRRSQAVDPGLRRSWNASDSSPGKTECAEPNPDNKQTRGRSAELSSLTVDVRPGRKVRSAFSAAIEEKKRHCLF